MTSGREILVWNVGERSKLVTCDEKIFGLVNAERSKLVTYAFC